MGKKSKEKKKHRKEKRVKSKGAKEKKRKYSSSSSGSSSSEEEWVEKEPLIKEPQQKIDDWMSMDILFSGKTRKELNEKKIKVDKPKEFNLLDKPGQSSRELNPFWKNGGTGLPPERPEEIEPYTEKNRLRPDKLSSDTNSQAKLTANYEKYSSQQMKSNSAKNYSSYSSKEFGSTQSPGCSKSRYPNDKPDQEKSKRQKHCFKRPDEESFFDSAYHSDNKNWKRSAPEVVKNNLSFKKPADEPLLENYYRSSESYSSRKNWKKPVPGDQTESKPASERYSDQNQDSSLKLGKAEDRTDRVGESSSNAKITVDSDADKVLSLNEMNELSASILKAELMGNKALAEELKNKLKEARLKKEASNVGSEIYDEKGRKVVVLTETDSKGFTRPAKSLEHENTIPKKKKKAETHEANKRVRYFADDDKYSLNDMFEKEKFSSTEDQNATFLKLMRQQKGNDDMDDEAAFDSARFDDNEKEDRRRRDQTIRKLAAKEKILDNCRFCISNKNSSNDCIVLTKEKVYLAVPSFQSLTDRHCLIIPQYHVPCLTLVDEDVWDEIKELRKILVRACERNDEDVIFFESAMYISKHPHMVLQCVPVPREIGDMAPIYFKKAIMECESEWSNNKKLVELAGKGVRRAVPKGLPYFAVDFGLQDGYAHVIEDKQLFPNNFAQEIIGGMLDLDHMIWRKQRKDTPENIEKKVRSLQELINNN